MGSIEAVVVYSLAAGAVVDLWMNGSIFAPLRARAEAAPLPGWARELLGCTLCMTFQAALWLVLLLHLPASWSPPAWAAALEAPATFLAAGRLARLVDGLLPERLRHDRPASL